jgi:hypothetical protein
MARETSIQRHDSKTETRSAHQSPSTHPANRTLQAFKMPLSTSEKTNETAANLVKTLKGAFNTPPGFRPGQLRCPRANAMY